MTKRRQELLCHAVDNLCRERVPGGRLKDIAAKMNVTIQYVSLLFNGRKALTAPQLNRLLDVASVSDRERRRLNRWGAREAGWRF